jgi:hypothetical protein
MTSLYLYSVVFISGAAVLAIEILGTRILAPFYGVSLFLWSALIAVTLAALSVGYAVGGRLADKGGNDAAPMPDYRWSGGVDLAHSLDQATVACRC